MKEILKLIGLLNEYGKEKGNPFDEWGFNSNDELFCKGLSSWYSEILIISKKFGFIKWLVENDKIDYDKAKVHHLWKERYSNYESILMKLSIQDEPISFLISLLK